jgi:tetratricopeptide (TPR) repeat protein
VRSSRGARRAPARLLAATLVAVLALAPASGADSLQGADALGRAYAAILDAEFEAAAGLVDEACPPAPAEACLVLEATRQLWRIQIDPEQTRHDEAFLAAVTAAIAAAEAWTTREPQRAEAWFYLGGAYGARVQWRVLRHQTLAAARDGKRIKQALDRALALDADLHDAQFGLGLYEYYADVAPTAARILRMLLLLPGGDRARGLARMQTTRRHGLLLADEAAFQLHVVYLWYERRAEDAVALLRELVRRHPHTPYFRRLLAETLDVYLHDASASLAVARELLALAQAGRVHEPMLAEAEARYLIGTQLLALGETDRAAEELTALAALAPAAPFDMIARAQLALGGAWDRLGEWPRAQAAFRAALAAVSRDDPFAVAAAARRALQRPTRFSIGEAHRLGLEAWRAFERDPAAVVVPRFERSLALDPANGVTRYHYARALAGQRQPGRAIAELELLLARPAATPAAIVGEAALTLGRLCEQAHDAPRALAAYRRAAATFGAAAATRAIAARAADRLSRTRPPA